MAHSFRVPFIMAEKMWWPKHETAGHFVSVVRKRREMTVKVYLPFHVLFIQSRIPAGGIVKPIIRDVLPISVNLI